MKRASVIILALALVVGLVPAAPAEYCGCMDVVLVVDDTGSMGGAIDNVKLGLDDIVDVALAASGGDLRMALVSFKDTIEVDLDFSTDMTVVKAKVNALYASAGAGEPEASDEAVKYVATGSSACEVQESLGSFRDGCKKIIVLVTDARPGGCDDTYTPGVDDVNAHDAAMAAAVKGILISAVFVPTWGDPYGVIEPIMQYYASTTGGAYRKVNADGTGTAAALEEIIAACGAEVTAKFDLKPGSCPNAFNRKEKGVVPAAILGSETFDVSTIDPASVQLCYNGTCISPLRWSIEDAAKPCEETGECACCAYYAPFDGYMDLALKFAAPQVAGLVSGAMVGDQVPLTIKFSANGKQYEATDCLKIVR